MDDAQIREAILGVFLEKPSDIRSSYGLYDYPAMWSLVDQDGITLAARPSRTLERVNFQYVETDGIAWRHHRDGKWLADDQERCASWDHFIGKVLRPAMEAGALPREGLDLDPPGARTPDQDPSP